MRYIYKNEKLGLIDNITYYCIARQSNDDDQRGSSAKFGGSNKSEGQKWVPSGNHALV